MKASVIFRFSNRSARRNENLRIILNFLRTKIEDLEFIVVAMEKDVDLRRFPWVRKRFVEAPFESAKANNIGASMSKTNLFFFQDADIIFRPWYYEEIIKKIRREGYESGRVGEECVNLGYNHVKRARTSPSYVKEMVNKTFKDSIRDAPGACIAITRQAFVRIGGHCERFKVYGWEDCYFRTKVRKMTKQFSLKKQTMHLPHEINYQMGRQAANAGLYQDLIANGSKDVQKFCERDRKDLLDKYAIFRSVKI